MKLDQQKWIEIYDAHPCPLLARIISRSRHFISHIHFL